MPAKDGNPMSLGLGVALAVTGGGGRPIPFSPATRSPLFWYKGSTLLQSAGVVTSWPDSSGNGHTLTPNLVGPAYTAASASYNNTPVTTWVAATCNSYSARP